MTLAIDKIENFFGAKFEPLDAALSKIRELRCFDGHAHWCLLWDEDRKMLYFTADKNAHFSAFPTLEIEVYYSGLQVSLVPGVGEVLMLRPLGAKHSNNLFVLTKTNAGRLSLATSLGESDEIGKIPPHWFEDENS